MKISLREVSKSYRSVVALDRVSLTIEPGQIVSLVGPNGAGKTTLIRCISGIVAPDRGAVCFDEEPFRRDRLALRRRMFVLPDFPPLFANQTVLRSITIALRLYGAEGGGADETVMTLLRDFDLLPLALRPVRTLSRGQAYKAALVALLAVDVELWLIDEPFASGMDPHGIDYFRRHARAAAARGRTIIYSTQILDVAERFSDRVCIIDDGKIHAFDTVEKLRENTDVADNVLSELFRRLREDSTT